jgi:hypothetical protein
VIIAALLAAMYLLRIQSTTKLLIRDDTISQVARGERSCFLIVRLPPELQAFFYFPVR